MARRAAHPTPLALNSLTHNIITGFYEITEQEITYSMPLEVTRQLKEYYLNFPAGHKRHYPTLERWYSDLPKELKKQVKRTGKIPPQRPDFFPDPEYD